MSTAYELQIYQNGQWQFDSYFDDRDTVVSEAERMNGSGRYAGVRILEEVYNENKNACEYHVIFSRLGKDNSPGGDWRDKYQGMASQPKAAADRGAAKRAQPRQRSLPDVRKAKKGASPVVLIVVAVVLVLAGVGAIITLRTFAGIG
jgi:hypothetical protein